jgi:hypothetical protein
MISPYRVYLNVPPSGQRRTFGVPIQRMQPVPNVPGGYSDRAESSVVSIPSAILLIYLTVPDAATGYMDIASSYGRRVFNIIRCDPQRAYIDSFGRYSHLIHLSLL